MFSECKLPRRPRSGRRRARRRGWHHAQRRLLDDLAHLVAVEEAAHDHLGGGKALPDLAQLAGANDSAQRAHGARLSNAELAAPVAAVRYHHPGRVTVVATPAA